MTGSSHVRSAFVVAGLLLPAGAAAQPGNTPGFGAGQPRQPGQPGQAEDKKEGPAEAAPKDDEALQPITPVPAHPVGNRRLQIFELHGYMRTRADYFHRLDLGLAPTRPGDTAYSSGNFFQPPAQTPEANAEGDLTSNDADCRVRLATQGVPNDKIGSRCGRRAGFASANMRLRLEPTLHVTDTVRVHAQIDALDNLVLGSTPDSYGWDNPWAPIDLYTRTQTPPTSGINSFTDSIVVKRAWGEIGFGFGLNVQFGRMPRHWGMGILYNDGNGLYRGEQADIVRMLDTDYGDSVDSIRLAYDFGNDRRSTHTLALSWDWAASGPTTAQVLGPEWDSGGRVGQAFSVERFDNLYQWVLSLERRDSPDMLRRKLSLGEPVLNYGVFTQVRYQDVDRAIGSPNFGNGLGLNDVYYDDYEPPNPTKSGGDPLSNGDYDINDDSGLNNYANVLVHRRALLFTPDVWFRVNWRTLRVELEAAGNVGRFFHRDYESAGPNQVGPSYFDQLTAEETEQRTRILSMGYALEFKYGFFRDRFHIGFDHGFATGDNSVAMDQNPQNPLLAGEGDNPRFNNFRFNPAYTYDLLLFREILGTTANAAYFKPWAAFYFFGNNFSARVDAMYALAANKTSTLNTTGHSYGIELDGGVRYHDQREPIFVQLQYGILFPLRALNRMGVNPDGSAAPEDARAAQSIQAQIGIRF